MLKYDPIEWTKTKFSIADLTTHLQLTIKLRIHFKYVFLILVQLMKQTPSEIFELFNCLN